MFRKIAQALLKQRQDQGLPLTAELLRAAWPMMVGDYFAAHTRPIKLDGARLIVAVSTDARLKEFTRLQDQLLARVNALMPTPLATLDLVLAWEGTFPPQRPQPPSPPPLGEVPPHEAELLARIDDDELRALVTRLRRLSRRRPPP